MKIFKRVLIFISLIMVFIVSLNIINVKAAETTIKCVNTNPAEDCNTAMNINYHLPSGGGGSCVYYTLKSDTAWASKKVAFPESENENTAFTQLNAVGENLVQVNVTLKNLTPGTEYMYYVECGTVKSKTYYFKTGSQYFNFVWTSDFHAYYADARRLNAATANIHECIEKLRGNVDFIFSTGDVVAHGGTYQWWEQLFGIDWIQYYMFANTLGNHDWMTKVGTNVSNGASHIFFSACHNNPKNGYSGQENVCYYFYYGDALFVCLNTEEFSQAQYNWCEEVLKNSDAQYKFLFQHYQMFNKAGGFNSAGYTRWHDLCDKYDVDVAFSGNSHVYVRSKQLYGGAVSSSETKGTVYMVAPSSDGERGEDPVALTSNVDKIAKSWAGGSNQVANSIVQVTENGISIQLINKGGEVLDNVSIAPKRPSSSRVKKDLSGVDKEKLENNLVLSVNNSNLAQPYLKYLEGSEDAIKYVTVRNKDTQEVYYQGQLVANKTRVKIDNYPVREIVNLEIIIDYWDATQKVLETTFVSRKDFGEIDDFKLNGEDDDYVNLIWYEDLNDEEVKCKEIYVNDDLVEEVELGTFNYRLNKILLPDNEEATIKIKVVSVIDDILAEMEIKYTKVVNVYANSITITPDVNIDDIEIGDEIKFSFTLSPADAIDEVKFSVSDTSVATISKDGVLVFKKAGEVIVTCESKTNASVKATFAIRCQEKEETPEPTLEPTGEIEPTEPVQPTEEPGSTGPDTTTEKKSGCKNLISLFNVFMVIGLAFVFRKKNN